MKQRKDGRYLKVISVGGKKLYFYSTAPTERAAEKDIQRQILEFKEKKENGKSFHQVLENWKEKKMDELPVITWNKSYKHYSELLDDYFDQTIKDITPGDIDRLFKTLAAQGYSRKSVSMYKCVLNQIFNTALVNGDISHNFILSIAIPQNLPKAKRKMPTDEEIDVIRKHYKGFDLLPYFLLYSGLRISEALALTDQDIDLKNKLIIVNKKLLHNGNTPEIINKTKTAAGKREVLLLDRLADKIPKFKGILFCNQDGEYFTKSQLRSSWEAWQKKYGLSVTAHQLRHGFATMLLEAGIEPKDAQELMGHADIKMTMDIYAEIRSKRKEQTREKLNAFDF